MGQVERVIASRGGGHAQADELGRGLAAPAPAVADDQAVGVVLADRPGHALDDLAVNLGLEVRWLIEQVEAELAVRDALESPGEMSPVQGADVLGLGIGPERFRLRRAGHRVARGSMEIELDVDSVLLAEPDGLVELV